MTYITTNPNMTAHLENARRMTKNGATKQEVMTATMQNYMMGMAKARFGDQLESASTMAQILEEWSKQAQAGDYAKLLKWGTFPKLYSMYDKTHDAIGELFMTILAPDALSPAGFVSECQTTTHLTISPTCQACGELLTFCSDYVESEPLTHSIETVCECSKCGLESTLEIQIVKPQSESERLTRSYIRSLLDFEGYNKDHGLGPIHDSRIVAYVAEQAAKALVHLPDSFSTDYQKITLDEMTR